MFADLKFTLRVLAKSPGFAAVAVLTLGLAIGVNSATFSFVRDTFFRPLLRDARSHLVSVYTRHEGAVAADRDFRRFSYREFVEIRGAREAFADVSAVVFGTGALGRDDRVQRSLFCLVSENYFSLLGISPARGRFFSAEECRPNAGLPVVVASWAYWQRLGRPADFVGSQLQIDGRNYTVIGIAPAGFGGLHVAIAPAVWLPLGAAGPLISTGLWGSSETSDLSHPHSYRLELIGALQPGLTLDAARARLGPLAARLTTLAGGGTADVRQVMVAPPLRFSLGSERPLDESFLPRFAAIALGMAASVLLVACLNLASLLLARGLARQREFAIRLSLGATRGRVVRQLMVEGLLLALAGGAIGVLLSWWTGDLIQQFNAEIFHAGMFTFNAHAPIDVGSLVVMFALCLVATLTFSFVPALRATKLDLVTDLKRRHDAPAGTGAWTRFFSLGHCLVMGQIALALMLLFGAGLFLRGAWNASRLDYGFSTAGELVANVDYSLGDTPTAEVPRRQQALLARAAELPGVTQAALASAIPYNFEGNRRSVFVAGATDAAGHDGVYTAVSRDYFRTLGIPLLRGRDFTAEESASDRGPHVAIVDEQLARALFGAQDPLGRRVAFHSSRAADRDIEIVGIVRSPRDEVFDEAAPPRLYQPLGQAPATNTYLHLAVEPAAASALLERLPRELRALDAENAVLLARPLGDFVTKNINLSLVHFAAIAFGVFGTVSLVLTIVGVYGVKACAVVRRTHEIGIRLALGAQRRDVVALILTQSALQTAVGLGVGLGLALVAGQILSKMLYRVSPFDPLALAVAAVVIAASTLTACFVPARRAAKVDPMIALRAE